jgi:hypothetical protein
MFPRIFVYVLTNVEESKEHLFLCLELTCRTKNVPTTVNIVYIHIQYTYFHACICKLRQGKLGSDRVFIHNFFRLNYVGGFFIPELMHSF